MISRHKMNVVNRVIALKEVSRHLLGFCDHNVIYLRQFWKLFDFACLELYVSEVDRPAVWCLKRVLLDQTLYYGLLLLRCLLARWRKGNLFLYRLLEGGFWHVTKLYLCLGYFFIRFFRRLFRLGRFLAVIICSVDGLARSFLIFCLWGLINYIWDRYRRSRSKENGPIIFTEDQMSSFCDIMSEFMLLLSLFLVLNLMCRISVYWGFREICPIIVFILCITLIFIISIILIDLMIFLLIDLDRNIELNDIDKFTQGPITQILQVMVGRTVLNKILCIVTRVNNILS